MKIAGKMMHLADGTPAIPLQPLVYQTNKPVPGPMGPPGEPGPPGELTMMEILDLIQEKLDAYSPPMNYDMAPHQPEEWTFDVERDEMGFIKTIVARR